MSKAELSVLVDRLRERERSETPTVEEVRQGFIELVEAFTVPDEAIVELVDVDGIAAEWVADDDARDDKALLYLHGGGYVIGSPDTHRLLAYNLSLVSGLRVLSLDYRLAPEHPFPAAVEDAVTAFGWLIKQGLLPERLAIGGESAGGGLTIATLLALKSGNNPLPACAVCASPWIDLEMGSTSMTTRAEMDPLLQRESLVWFADHYINGGNPRDPLASPIHGNLSNLPEILIQVGSAEVLYDDAIRLHSALRSSGNASRLEIWQDMIHIWHIFAPVLGEAEDAIEQIGHFLKEKIGD